MDETVYQCPECNFNTDNLNKLDEHITQIHEFDDAQNICESAESGASSTNSNGNVSSDEGCDDNRVNHNSSSPIKHQHNSNNNNHPSIYVNNYYDEEEDDDDDEFGDDDGGGGGGGNDSTNKGMTSDDDNINNSGLNNQSINYDFYENGRSQYNNNNINNKQIRSNQTQSPFKLSLHNTNSVPNTDNHYERQYSCKLCSYFTNNPRAILYHRKEVHMEKIPVYECAYCQYASQYSGKVERHTLLRHKIDIANAAAAAAAAAASTGFTSNTNNVNNTTNNSLTNILKSSSNTNLFDNNNEQQKDASSALNTSSVLNTSSTNQPQQQQISSTSSSNNNNSTTIGSSGSSMTTFQCNLCPCKYKRSNDLYKHLKLKHNQSNPSIRLQSSSSSNNHHHQQQQQQMNDHSPLNDYQQASNDDNYNENNDTSFENSNMINNTNNNNQDNGTGTGKYLCPYCTYQSNNENNDYLQHVKEHICGKTFRCVLCNAIYKYRGDCVVHLKRKHQKADLIAQNYVERFVIDEIPLLDVCSILKPKMYDEIDNDEKLFGCCYCDYKANYKGDVYKHQTRRHPGTVKNVKMLNNNGTNVSSSYLNNTSLNDTASLNCSLGGGGDSSLLLNRSQSSNRFDNNFKLKTEPYNDNQMSYNDMNDDDNQSMNSTTSLNMDNSDVMTMNDQYDDNDGDGNNTNTNNDRDYDSNDDYSSCNGDNIKQENDQQSVDSSSNGGYNQHHSNQYSYGQHSLQSQNQSIKLFECNLCPYRAKSSAKLQFHLATHDNLKPYMCPVCKRRANFKWDIQKHLRKVHQDAISEVVCLSQNEARETINEYIECHGNNYSKRNYYLANNTNNTNILNTIEPIQPTKTPTPQPQPQQQQMNIIYKCSVCSYSSNEHINLTTHINQQHGWYGNIKTMKQHQHHQQQQQQQQQQQHNDTDSTNPYSTTSIQPYIVQMSTNIINNNNNNNNNNNKDLDYSSDSKYDYEAMEQNKQSPSLLNPALFLSKHSARERKYKCSLCNRTSKWQWDIRKHLRTVHKEQTGDVVVLNDKDLIRKLTENPSYSRSIALLSSSSASSIQSPSPSPLLQQQRSQPTPTPPPPPPPPLHSQPTKSQSISSSSHINTSHYHQSIGSDLTGNKKFKCTMCPYRSNWKADLFRHIRKRHCIEAPTLSTVIILSPEEAASTIGEYEQTHGMYIRKRSRIELEPSSTGNANNASLNENSAKRQRILLPSNGNNNNEQTSHSSSTNNNNNNNNNTTSNNASSQIYQAINAIDNHKSLLNDSNNNNNHQSTSHQQHHHHHNHQIIASTSNKIQSKPFQCMKCLFRSNHKSDVLRHLKVRHAIHSNEYLRILSEDEALSTLTDYENRRFLTNNNKQPINNNNPTITIVNSAINAAKPLNQQQINGHKSTLVNGTTPQTQSMNGIDGSVSYYKCSYCLFKHSNKAMVRKHMLTHQNKINGFKCNVCPYTSEWRYSVKKHIIATHWLVPHAAVVKCTLKPHIIVKKGQNNETNHNNNISPSPTNTSANNNNTNTSNNGKRQAQHITPTVNNQQKEQQNKQSKLSNEQLKENIKQELIDNNENNEDETNGENNDENELNNNDCIIKNEANDECSDDLNNSNSEENGNGNDADSDGGENVNNGVDECADDDENIDEIDERFVEDEEDDENNDIDRPYASRNSVKINAPSSLVTPNGKSYTSAFVSTSPTGLPGYTSNGGSACGKKKMYFCQNCPYKTNNYCNLKQHLLQHRPQAGHAKCRYCPYYVSMSRLLKQHEVLHPEYVARDRDTPLRTSTSKSLLNNSINNNVDDSYFNESMINDDGQQLNDEKDGSSTSFNNNNSINNSSRSPSTSCSPLPGLRTTPPPQPPPYQKNPYLINSLNNNNSNDVNNTKQQQQSTNEFNNEITTNKAQLDSQRSNDINERDNNQNNNKNVQNNSYKLYRCKHCSFTNTSIEAAKAHGLTHLMEQQKKLSSSNTTTLTSTNVNSSSNKNNSTSSSLSPSSSSSLTTTSTSEMYNNLLECPFCNHKSKNSFGANQHLLYHLDNKNELPIKNLFLEEQIRQILTIPTTATNSKNTNSTSSLSKTPQQQQQASKQTKQVQQPQSNVSEYIDIAEYEKFFAVLQEAADEQ